MKIIKGGMCAAKGFFASATEANIKYKNRTDMAMIFSKVPAISAGTYTTNLVKAAPVLWDRKIPLWAFGSPSPFSIPLHPLHRALTWFGKTSSTLGSYGTSKNTAH